MTKFWSTSFKPKFGYFSRRNEEPGDSYGKELKAAKLGVVWNLVPALPTILF